MLLVYGVIIKSDFDLFDTAQNETRIESRLKVRQSRCDHGCCNWVVDVADCRNTETVQLSI